MQYTPEMHSGDLTPKELEALALIAQGHDAKSAALELSLSPHTIYERLRRAREKIGANNSREAARMVFGQHGPRDEKFAPEKFVLSDVYQTAALTGLPGARAVEVESPEIDVTRQYAASSIWSDLKTKLPLRGPGEREVRATKIERLRLIGDLSSRLALAFVAICLAAMIVSNLFQRG